MKTYEVDGMAVAAYLDLKGLKYLGNEVRKDKKQKDTVYFKFEDPDGVGIDLERSYRNSPEKKYRDAFLFFRNEIFKSLERRK